MLISVDALRPAFYRDARHPMPALQDLARRGTSADAVRSVFPALTYPAHTTLVTGALPVRHGVWHNRPFQPSGQTGEWVWNADAITARTLWDAVRARGGTTAAISWPVTVDAPIDWNIPDVWPLDGGDAMPVFERAARPRALIDELERNATGTLTDANFAIARAAREDRVGAIASYLFERYRPTLLLAHCIAVDHAQHVGGMESPLLPRAMGAVDRAIGQVVETLERLDAFDRTALIVTGDHGTAPVRTRVRPNVWLVERGLMQARDDRGDWRACFMASGGSAFLRLRDAHDADAVAIARAAVDARVAELRDTLRVVERDELTRLGADPLSPFALAAAPGVELHESPSGPVVEQVAGAGHGYLPSEPAMQTGFVAVGPGFDEGRTVPCMTLADVAATVGQLLDLDFVAADGAPLPRR